MLCAGSGQTGQSDPKSSDVTTVVIDHGERIQKGGALT